MYENLEPSRKNIVYLSGRREKLPNTIYPDKTLLIHASHLLFLGPRYRDMGKKGNIFYFLYFYTVATGNNLHTRAFRLQLILFSKIFGAF
jgi:hypothetical protein